ARPVFHKTGYFVSAKNAAAEVFNHFVENLRGFFIFRMENICRNMVVFLLRLVFFSTRLWKTRQNCSKLCRRPPFLSTTRPWRRGFGGGPGGTSAPAVRQGKPAFLFPAGGAAAGGGGRQIFRAA